MKLFILTKKIPRSRVSVGVPIVFLSACLAIPPLYAVTLAVPATRMSVIPFGVAVLLGRMALFLAIAFGVSALVD